MYVPLHYYCSLHLDPILLHIKVQKKWQTATYNYHATVIYVPTTDMPLEMPYMPIS